MQLAHGVINTGPDIEFLIVAAGLLALAILFFVQKTTKPVVSVVLAVGAFALAVGAFVGNTRPVDSHGVTSSEEPEPGASIEIVSPADGTTVPAGEPVTVEIGAEGVPEGGHFDVQIDGNVASMTNQEEAIVTFEEGEHVLTVDYVDVQHQAFDPPLQDEVTVTAE